MKTVRDFFEECIHTYLDYLKCYDYRPFRCWGCIHSTACNLLPQTADKILEGELYA